MWSWLVATWKKEFNPKMLIAFHFSLTTTNQFLKLELSTFQTTDYVGVIVMSEMVENVSDKFLFFVNDFTIR